MTGPIEAQCDEMLSQIWDRLSDERVDEIAAGFESCGVEGIRLVLADMARELRERVTEQLAAIGPRQED